MYSVVTGPEPARARVIPDYLEVSVGDMVEFRCDVTGGPPRTRIEWSRDVGDLPINAVMRDGVLRFQATSDDQQGRYECHVSTETGQTLASATSTLVIRVGMYSAIIIIIITFISGNKAHITKKTTHSEIKKIKDTHNDIKHKR